MPVGHVDPLVEGVQNGDAVGVVDVGIALVGSHDARTLQYLRYAVHRREIPEHTARNGQQVLPLGAKSACGEHPKGTYHSQAVIEPGVEHDRLVPVGAAPVVIESEQGGGCGEHGEVDGILSGQLVFGDEHQGQENEIEIAYLHLLHEQILDIQLPTETQPHGEPIENGTHASQHGCHDHDVLPFPRHLGNGDATENSKRRRCEKQNDVLCTSDCHIIL